MSGIFILGLTLVRSKPWLAGVVLGAMVLKPQLALLLPVAMLASREWRVIAGAICSAGALLLVGLILFGWSSYQAFFDILPHYVAFMRDSRLPWNELASPFALARFAGLAQAPALFIHVVVAAVAVIVTARAWWLRLDTRIPMLAAATMLVPPYFLTYDAVLLVVPIGWMIRERCHAYTIAIVWLCALLPIINYYSPIAGPNLTSIAAMISLWVLRRGTPVRASGEAPAPASSAAAAASSS
jgi:hypothetical protein